MALPATDDFNRASLGSNWTTINGAFAIYGSDDVYPNSPGTECAAIWNADTFNADQYAQIVIAAWNTGLDPYIGVCLRGSSGPNYYVAYAGRAEANSYVIRVVGGTITALFESGSTNFTLGSVMRMEVEGTTLRLYNGSTPVWTGTDTSLPSGSAGLSGYSYEEQVRGDDWEGGNLGATAVSDAPRPAFRQRLISLLTQLLGV